MHLFILADVILTKGTFDWATATSVQQLSSVEGSSFNDILMGER